MTLNKIKKNMIENLPQDLDILNEHFEENVNVLSKLENKYDQYNIGAPGTGFVSFVDDDGHRDVYNILKPMFDVYGKKFTAAIITSYPDVQQNYMTWSQIKEMSEQGFEIASHTHTHQRLASLTNDQQIFEMEESKRQLISKGLNPHHIVYPQGDYNNFTMENVLRFYRSGVATALSAYQDGLRPPLLEGKVSRIGLGSWQNFTTEEIKTKIDKAVAEGRWIIFMTHVWANDSFPAAEGNIQAIQNILDYCVSKNVNIVTYDEGFRRYSNRQMLGNNNITNKPFHIIGADYKEYTNQNQLMSKVQKTELGFSALPNAYEFTNDITITYKEMSASEANSDLAPVKLAGMLITESFRIRNGYAKQTYKVFESDDIYIRTGKSDNTWGLWTRMSASIYSPVQLFGTELPNYFKINSTTYREIPGEIASNLPSAKAGILITERFGTSLGYVKQMYKTHQLNDIYVRSGKDDNTWTSWIKIGGDVGTTANRPIGVNAGYMYFDTTLAKPIWWSGTMWRDATGTPV